LSQKTIEDVEETKDDLKVKLLHNEEKNNDENEESKCMNFEMKEVKSSQSKY
jgi:hypothetical protein